ncbi:MAG: helix-turn-helix transcriptional regulator [Myxococcales bacterium]|nr:helix-turn-helix transcriptional regulator [Myxococcales bacterium]
MTTAHEPLFGLATGTRARELSGPFGRLGRVLRTADEVREAYVQHRRARWIATDSTALKVLLGLEARDTWHRLLLLEHAGTARREILHALFRVVIAPDDRVRLLAPEEMADVLADEHAENFFIGGVVDRDDKAIVLYRGNLEPLLVPLDWFRAKPRRPEPDFDALALTDSGNTVQLGEYEAATDAILYEFDPEARRRFRAREIRKDPSFGGSLLRLRLQKGLSRSDFAPLSSKTIARIERNEVEAPHGDTLEAIARRLGVPASEIGSY